MRRSKNRHIKRQKDPAGQAREMPSQMQGLVAKRRLQAGQVQKDILETLSNVLAFRCLASDVPCNAQQLGTRRNRDPSRKVDLCAVYRRHCHSKSRAYAMIMRFAQAAADWSDRAVSAIRAPRNLTGRGP